MVRLLALLALFIGTSPASAAWQKAKTNQFVVYADDTPENVAAKARELELFDATLKIAFGLPVASQPNPNPVTLFLVRDVEVLQRLYGSGGAGVAGFYRPGASGAVAFMPQRTADGSIDPRIVLFHEYGHHFLLGNFAQAFPAWFVEGFSEFVSTFQLTTAGAELGRPAMHRANMLRAISDEPITDLFMPGPKNVAAVYGQGWLLTHYFMTSPERRKLLDQYFRNIHSGMRDPDAGIRAFGPLGKLGTEIRRYFASPRFSGFRIDPAKLPNVSPKVAPLGAAEAAMIGWRMTSVRGVDEQRAADLYKRAAPVAALYPDDPVVQGWMAEIAHDAKQWDAGDAAADRALARDPNNFQALLYKGKIGLGRAKAGGEGAAAHYDSGRRWIARANRVSPDHAEPLWLTYQSYVDQDRKPTPNAVAALYRSVEVVPQDTALRVAAMRQRFLDGETEEGRQLLGTLAFNVHSNKATPIDKLSTAIDAGTPPLQALTAYDKEIADLKAKAEAKRKKPG